MALTADSLASSLREYKSDAAEKKQKAEFRTQNHDCDEDPESSAKCQSTGISNSQSRRRWLHSSTPQTSPLELKTDQWGRAQTPIISA